MLFSRTFLAWDSSLRWAPIALSDRMTPPLTSSTGALLSTVASCTAAASWPALMSRSSRARRASRPAARPASA
eukprot:CAMPEP_0168428540 /NCGR_PEP_ID=MMETSP0228-20121227/36911_1 /TAXON_ID=133427 /ORGANISM="Protoceratium reticulatum, Strain CCCM 535 (=CCMP 1889)" /LENGTH=72 /DNA_ID=CAMNT_0008442605 /DNA_START=110 /DNA_END=324 /DNA_ORIENTATION=+